MLKAYNNLKTILVSDDDTTIEVEDDFSDYTAPFRMTIRDETDMEIIEVTEIDGSTLTVDRAKEDTSQVSWSGGEDVRHLSTAGMHTEIADAADTAKADLDSHTGSGGDAHADVTTDSNGFMSSSDKSKLDGIESNANDYSLEEHDNSHHSDNYTTTTASDVNSSNWDDYEIQKNGTDGSGIINFKT